MHSVVLTHLVLTTVFEVALLCALPLLARSAPRALMMPIPVIATRCCGIPTPVGAAETLALSPEAFLVPRPPAERWL